MNESFSLRKLEMAMPYLEKADNPKALVNLAAIALADESSLKLIAAGNTETLQVFLDKAYDMPANEVAALLRNFIEGSQLFKLALDGFTPEEIQLIKLMEKKKAHREKNLPSPED